MDENSPDSVLVFAINMGYYARELSFPSLPGYISGVMQQGDHAYSVLYQRYRFRLIAYLRRLAGDEAEDIAANVFTQLVGDPHHLRASLDAWFRRSWNWNPEDPGTFPENLKQANRLDPTDEILRRFQVLSTHCRPDRNVKSWMFQLAHNAAVDWIARSARSVQDSVFATEVDDESDSNYLDELQNADRRVSRTPPTDEELKEARRLFEQLEHCRAQLTREEQVVIVLRDEEGLTADEVAEVLGIPASKVYRLHQRALERLCRCMCKTCCDGLDESQRLAVDLHIAQGVSRADAAKKLGISENQLVDLLTSVKEAVRPCRGALSQDEQQLFRLHIIDGLDRPESHKRMNEARNPSDPYSELQIKRMICGMFCTRPG